MPIPERLRLNQAPSELVESMSDLCVKIADTLESGGNADSLLVEWNRHAGRTCEPHEFISYWKSTDKIEFVRNALNPKAEFLANLTYEEAFQVLESLALGGELEENESQFYLGWLEAQFPNSNMKDLIFWPDEWFDDASLIRDSGGAFKPEAELSIDQMLAYAMEKSGRSLPNRPTNVKLPFPLPRSDK